MLVKLGFLTTLLSFLTLLSSCGSKKTVSPKDFSIVEVEAPTIHPKFRQIPVTDFFKKPEMTSIRISPNGEKLAFLKAVDRRLNLFVRSADNFDKEEQLTELKDRDISYFFWKDNWTIVFSRDFGGNENFHYFSLNLKNKKVKNLTPFKGSRAVLVDDLRYVDRKHILIAVNNRDKKYFDVFRANIHTGTTQRILKNTKKFTSFMTDHRGQIRLGIQTDGVNRTVFKRQGGEFKKLISTNFKESFYPISFDANNRHVYAVSNLGRDKQAIVLYDIQKNKEKSLVFSNEKYDVDHLVVSEITKKPLAVEYSSWKPEKFFLDPDFEKTYEAVKKQVKKGMLLDFLSVDSKLNRYVVVTSSDRSPGNYYLYDKTSQSLKFLASRASWLKPEELAPMTPIRLEARDKLTLEGYVTLPLKAKLSELPTVILVHGGPWARDNWGYNRRVQFLANRGYAVLQLNFRGSTGYGKDFWMKSFKQWGKTMQNDLSDGVKWLVDKGISDPNKICIMGGSYGGYAVLAGLAFTPKLYACGIDYVGVSNIFTLLNSIPPYWEPYREMLYEQIGHPEKDKELLTEVSPFFHVDKIKAPLLVAHGANDPRVKLQESDQIVQALEKKGVDVPYIVKENEGHGFRNEENRIELFQEIETFLAKHIGN